MPDEEIEDIIADLAGSPRRVQGDNGNSIEQQSIQDLIAADKYLRSKTAASNGIGIRYTKLIPPGAD